MSLENITSSIICMYNYNNTLTKFYIVHSCIFYEIVVCENDDLIKAILPLHVIMIVAIS